MQDERSSDSGPRRCQKGTHAAVIGRILSHILDFLLQKKLQKDKRFRKQPRRKAPPRWWPKTVDSISAYFFFFLLGLIMPSVFFLFSTHVAMGAWDGSGFGYGLRVLIDA